MNDAVQQIKDRLSIVDVIAPYVELHPAGKNLKGKSPFTSEKTPSFFVSPDRGMYYCFSSSKGGDMFTFVQEMEGVDFKEALKFLAERAGVQLVAEDPKKRSERDQGYSILEAATTFYMKQLADTPAARDYLKDRGVTGETIARWRLGYAPGPPQSGWRELRTELKNQNFTDLELQKVGLVKTAGEGKEPYDVFRDRVMFPIFDQNGKVVAFSGRILHKDSDAPKYVNSPETEFFNKSEILYGYDKAKQGIRKFDFSLIVEGQFDVVLSHQAGYHNAVAVSGTALTPHHVSLLQRLSNRVVLALDADRAGIAAVKRAADLMLIRGLDVKVAKIPEGSDPADIIKADPAQFKTIIGGATHVIDFLLAVTKTDSKDERTYKLRVRDEVLPYIAKMDNHIDADHFEGVVAAAIGGSKEAVHAEVVRHKDQAAKTPRSIGSIIAEKDSPARQKGSRRADLLKFLVVAADLVEPATADCISLYLIRGTNKSLIELKTDISAADQSQLLFSLEAEFTKYNQRQLFEELNAKLKEFELLSIKERLAEEKERLFAAEDCEDSDAVAKSSSAVAALQHELSKAGSRPDPLTIPSATNAPNY